MSGGPYSLLVSVFTVYVVGAFSSIFKESCVCHYGLLCGSEYAVCASVLVSE